MNLRPRTWLAATLLAAAVPSQDASGKQALARAQLLEKQEHDLAAAEQAYRTLLSNPNAADVAGKASLRLGALLWRLDRRQEATTLLESAIELGDAYGGDRADAEEAKAILEGRGEQQKLAQERLVRARSLVALLWTLRAGASDGNGNPAEPARRQRVDQIVDDLRTLGAEGAEAIAEFLDNHLVRGKSIAKYVEQPDPWRRRVMSLLWQIGTPPAATALKRWSESDDVAVRCTAAEGVTPTKVAADLEPVLFTYVRDPDPAGEVWRLAVTAVAQLPHERHVELLAASDAPTRAAGLFALVQTWRDVPPDLQERFVADHGAAVRRATHDADPRVVNQAWLLIRAFAGGPRSAALVFFAEAERYPASLDKLGGVTRIDANDAFLRAAADAAGKATERAKSAMSTVLEHSARAWTSAAVDDVVRLLELCDGDHKWAVPAVRLANEQQLARLIALLPQLHYASWVSELAQRPLPASTFPALRTVVEDACARGRSLWGQPPERHKRMVRGQTIDVAIADKYTRDLLRCAAGTGSPAGAAWLEELAVKHAPLAADCAALLATMAMQPGEARAAACSGLRKLLVWEGTEENELQPHERSQVFAALAYAGDVEAIPLFVRAYELGLAHTEPVTVGRQAGRAWIKAAGIGFLAELRDHHAFAWHGYRDADLATAWGSLLDSPMLRRALGDFSLGIDPTTGNAAGHAQGSLATRRIPLAALPIVCARWPAIRAAAEQDTAGDIYNLLSNALKTLDADDIAQGTELRAALAGVLRDDVSGAWLFNCLPDRVANQFADEGRAMLRSYVVLPKLLAAGIDLTDQEWREALSSGNTQIRRAALESVPAGRAAIVREAVGANFSHEDAEVRSDACAAAQRLFGADAVPDLLLRLQDREEKVRAAARNSLDVLREGAEQRAFWANAGAGIDTSQRGAASKLLAQAKAGEPKEQRLLALRSLAVLGVAESLPYLIDATKDQDTEIAAAARAAIAAIHGKQAPAEPAKK